MTNNEQLTARLAEEVGDRAADILVRRFVGGQRLAAVADEVGGTQAQVQQATAIAVESLSAEMFDLLTESMDRPWHPSVPQMRARARARHRAAG